MREKGKFLSPETGQDSFQEAQRAVSKVLGQHCFIKLSSFLWLSMKHELQAAIVKTGGRLIYRQEKLKEAERLKVSHFIGQINCN